MEKLFSKVNKFYVITIFSVCLFQSVFAQAQSTTSSAATIPSQTSTTTLPEKAEEKKSFSAAVGIEYSQNISVDQVGERERGTSIQFVPTYSFTTNLSLGAKAAVTKDDSGARETKMSDTSFKLNYLGYKFNDDIQLSHFISTVIPTSKESKETARLQGNIGVGSGISYTNPYIILKYSLALARNFHEYNFNADGNANVQYRLTHLIDVTIPITEKFYVTTLFTYKYGQTYGGFERNSFIYDADMNYDFTPKFTMNVGTSNEAAAFKANGVDSNINVYDEKTSVGRVGLSYVY